MCHGGCSVKLQFSCKLRLPAEAMGLLWQAGSVTWDDSFGVVWQIPEGSYNHSADKEDIVLFLLSAAVYT
jgi:hypothetical protein